MILAFTMYTTNTTSSWERGNIFLLIFLWFNHLESSQEERGHHSTTLASLIMDQVTSESSLVTIKRWGVVTVKVLVTLNLERITRCNHLECKNPNTLFFIHVQRVIMKLSSKHCIVTKSLVRSLDQLEPKVVVPCAN